MNPPTTPTSEKYNVSHPPFPVWEGNQLVAATDWLGNQFKVGDIVLYCISAMRSQLMAYGEVVDIKLADRARGWVSGQDEVKVQVRTIKTAGRWNNQERTRPVWVLSMNVTAMPIEIIEGKLQDLRDRLEEGELIGD